MKKKALRLVAVLFAFALMLTGLNMNPATVGAAKKATKITLNATKKTLYVGETATLKVKTVKPSNASKSVTWSTSKKSVATVKNGTVTAKKAGTAKITAVSKSNKKVKASCTITVKNPTTTFTKKTLTVNAADKTDLTKYLSVKGASKKVTWTSSKKSVATVSSTGKVTFKKNGTVTITAKANGKKATIKLTAPKLTISKTTATVWYPAQKSITLTAKASTVGGKKSTVKWSTSKASVATVKNGKVTFKKLGTVTITASANGVSKSCKVTAKKESTKLNKETISLYPTQTYTKLKATVAGRSSKVTFTSKKPSVATVNKSTGKVTAIKAGTAKIVAVANGKEASCLVTVKAPTLTLDKTEVKLTVGDKPVTVKATVKGASTKVTWTTSKASVATVVNGVITAKGEGTATITATANGVPKTVKVTVNKAPVVDPVEPPVEDADEFIEFKVSNSANAYKVVSGDRSYTVTAEELAAKKDRAIEFSNKYGADLEAMFKAVAVEGRTFTVRGKTVKVNTATANTANITVANVHGKVNGTYDVKIAKLVDGKYTLTATDVASKKTRTITVSIKLVNGVYTLTTTEAGFEFTLTAKANGTSAKLVARNTASNNNKEFTVATFDETQTSYVATYNKTFLENNLPLALRELGYSKEEAKDKAEEILERLDATTVTALN